jgi:hypothetical protein
MGGDTVFQVVLPLSKTVANVLPMIDAFTLTNDKNHSKLISAIEREGWKLDNASYVYRITRIESRDKFLASGQQEAVGGQIVAIYIFRATQCEHNAIKGR